MKKASRLSPVALLVSLVLAGCSTASHVGAGQQANDASASGAAPFEKIEERQMARDQGIYRETQARIADLNAEKGIKLDSYALAKAQCWLDVSFHEYTRNDRGGFPRAALQQAQGILDQLEAGQTPDVNDTPLVNNARRLRDDLWKRFEVLKSNPETMSCAASRLACAEVELVHAGNEIRQGGWRHASPYILIAEDLTAEAEKAAQQCGVKPAGTAGADAVAPVPTVTSVDVRFHFDRYGVDDILPEDSQKLEAFVKELNEQYVRIDSLNVVGHTDRMGGADYNNRLSMRRALTVRGELQRLGVDRPIAVVPMGATGDFSVGCGKGVGDRNETIACLQPDRRVTIEVVGAKRR